MIKALRPAFARVYWRLKAITKFFSLPTTSPSKSATSVCVSRQWRHLEIRCGVKTLVTPCMGITKPSWTPSSTRLTASVCEASVRVRTLLPPLKSLARRLPGPGWVESLQVLVAMHDSLIPGGGRPCSEHHGWLLWPLFESQKWTAGWLKLFVTSLPLQIRILKSSSMPCNLVFFQGKKLLQNPRPIGC